jgi:hypothetical protein
MSTAFARMVADIAPVLYFLLGLSGLTLIVIYFIPDIAVYPSTTVDSNGHTQTTAYTQSTSAIIEDNQPISKFIGHLIAAQVLVVLGLTAMPHYSQHPTLLYIGLVCWLGLTGVLTFDVSFQPAAHTACVAIFATTLLIYTHMFCLVVEPLPGAGPNGTLLTFTALLDISTMAFAVIFLLNWVVMRESLRGTLETYQSTAELVWETCIVMMMAALLAVLTHWHFY